jgi:hypothetical protein
MDRPLLTLRLVAPMISSSRAATSHQSAGFAGPSGPAFFSPENDKMEFQIPYTTDAERATATGPVDFDKLGEVIDGYEPDWRPIRAGEDVGHLTASLEASEALIKRMEAQLRFQHEVLAEIHELTGAESGTRLPTATSSGSRRKSRSGRRQSPGC